MKTQSLLAYFFPKQRAITKVSGRGGHSQLGGSLRAATKIGRCPKEIFSGPATILYSVHRISLYSRQGPPRKPLLKAQVKMK